MDASNKLDLSDELILTYVISDEALAGDCGGSGKGEGGSLYARILLRPGHLPLLSRFETTLLREVRCADGHCRCSRASSCTRWCC